MKKKYFEPSITLLPLGIVGPNVGSKGDDAEVQGDNYEEGMVWDEASGDWVWPDNP